ncbi:MAG: LLM class F420-dependent oxidoreductase [Anaerolineae bacterium UTCFX2]|jgi:probable F420-dependent oxidoreductase|nr:TIGR03617 family F420-dependent LLM class oxidoreductase [Anaerolineae bacterium]MCZ7552644.1 TIGR03617 family F420-dependent LLM class oxidoreductase [Anaerolineales bacterium]OQY93394.1 MAG: LLM class F420-dependent oxidoreductase [Anaerolineae bacterium UTCFX2]
MRLDVALPPTSLTAIPEIARNAEALGFDGLWSSETMHDPFLPGALIALHTQRVQFGTAVAIAFGRSPATLAYTAWDLAQASRGRFILGLGTQVKPHIEKRFGMPWPASVTGKLREQVGAIRAFWRSWQTGQRLDFRGEYYRLSLMTPFFNPGPIEHPDIPIYIAGVNLGLARLAGEIADGFVMHPFHSLRYLREVLAPAIENGLAATGRSRAEVAISATVFTVTSPDEDLLVRSQIGFYASTPSYQPVMALHGWQDAAEQLSALARRGDWSAMPAQISDEMLETFAVVGSADEIGARLKERYSGQVDRLSLYLPFVPNQRDAFWSRLRSEFEKTEPHP